MLRKCDAAIANPAPRNPSRRGGYQGARAKRKPRHARCTVHNGVLALSCRSPLWWATYTRRPLSVRRASTVHVPRC